MIFPERLEADSDGRIYREPSDAVARGEEVDPAICQIDPTLAEEAVRRRNLQA